ncbi:metallophosphoesterase [Candidatus Palauibacter sp.]|uniref:metallophosphoesterase n=1 Tax=Candidatus Palauibacter sp. TaxID=3101350 RepID=UPI003D13BA0A
MSGVPGCAFVAAAVAWTGASAPDSGDVRPSAGSPPPAGQEGWHVEGEYGLYVAFADPGLEVRWLTDDERPGLIRAIVEGQVVAEEKTDPGTAHAARLRVRAPEITLEYGAEPPDGAGGDAALHRTRIWTEPPPAQVDLTGHDSVFVFGDVHGEFDRVLWLLRLADLIDAELHWTGGGAAVAFLGDLFDRGEDVTRLLWFIHGLEREAEAAGGRVITLLGNHEAMVLTGDLRYLAPKEAMIADRHGMPYEAMFDPERSILGRWIAAKPGLVRLDDLLLAHGGVSPAYVDYSLQEYQDTLATFIAEPLFTRWRDEAFLLEFARETRLDSAQVYRRYDFFFGSESVLWYRDLVLSDTLGGHLDAVLERFGARTHVVGHTPVPTIRESYGGKLIAADLLDAATEMLRLIRRRDGGWNREVVRLDGGTITLDAATDPGT